MIELVVVSGKGGTGKTSITACLVSLAKKAIIADCDVDAANLHLMLKPKIKSTKEFIGGYKAKINESLCVSCGECESLCRFNAIKNQSVDYYSCEGCGVCYYNCRFKAIDFKENISGEYYESNTSYGELYHGKLNIAEGNSGKLVALIKGLANKTGEDIFIVDGPPGVGCPVISSLSGADVSLIVTEPTISAIHDFKRVLKLIRDLNVKPIVCINKYDLNIDNSSKIENYCNQNDVEVVGKISYDKLFNDSIENKKIFTELYPSSIASKQIKNMWEKIKKFI